LRIAYVLGFLTTYVLEELRELRRHGVETIVIVPTGKKLQLKSVWRHIVGEEAFLGEPVHFLPDSVLARSLTVLAMHFAFLVANPRRYKDYVQTVIRMARIPLSTKQKFRVLASGAAAPYFARIAKESRVERIHVHFALDHCDVGIFIASLLRLPLSITLHANDIFAPVDVGLLKARLDFADLLVSVSEFNKRYITERLGADLTPKLSVVHCGIVPLPPKVPTNRRLGVRPLVLSVASGLVEKKGIEYLILACARLKQMGIRFRCVIVGSDKDSKRLARYRSLVALSGLEEEIQLPGIVSTERLHSLYGSASVFVLPSVTATNGDMEGIPVSLMEAMSAGLPVVATSISGIPELVEGGVSGLLVPEKDPEALAGAIGRLLADPDFAQSLGRSGRAKIMTEFNIRQTAVELVRLLRNQNASVGTGADEAGRL